MRYIGYKGESIAEQYLIKNRYFIVEKNYYTRFGELDIIASKQHHLHIIEVKLSNNMAIHPGIKLNKRKQQRMIRCTQLFLIQHHITQMYVQFDLIIIRNESIDHLKNVFCL